MRSIIISLLVVLLGLISLSTSLTIQWNGVSGLDWADRYNWDPQQVPTINDDVLIVNDTDVFIFSSSGPAYARSVTLSLSAHLAVFSPLTTSRVISNSADSSVYLYTTSTLGDVSIGTLYISSGGRVSTTSLKTPWLSLSQNSILSIGRLANSATTLWLTPNATLNGTLPATFTTDSIYLQGVDNNSTVSRPSVVPAKLVPLWEKAQQLMKKDMAVQAKQSPPQPVISHTTTTTTVAAFSPYVTVSGVTLSSKSLNVFNTYPAGLLFEGGAGFTVNY